MTTTGTLPQTNELSIVGIGASAGGLRAIEDFFQHLPCDSGAAYIIIQHLSPDFKSLMKEILGQRTQMPIQRVTDGMPLERDTIFLIPPGQNMVLQDHHLKLTAQDRDSGHQPHFPIDLFFQSLSVEGREQAISIILSGTGSDGTKGIRHVSEMGGIVMVQDPTESEFDGMPRSAISTSTVDLVLSAKELAEYTYQVVTSPEERQAFHDQKQAHLHPRQLQQIIDLVERYENINFTQYKESTLTRRIQRRCLIAGYETLGDYIYRLESSEEERTALRNDLLITVTRFFRDKEAWQFLRERVLPQIVTDAVRDRKTIRVWVTACATGEEAYSIAILLRELLDQADSNIEAKIFATDIDPVALSRASTGLYPAAAIDSLSIEQQEKFFVAKGEHYEVSRPIREMIIFANHNLTKDAGFTQMDLVSCRNVLIYMQPQLQQYVLRSLHFSLKTGSTLFLGESENLGDLAHEFEPLEKKWNIYKKLRDVKLPMVSQHLSTLQSNQARLKALSPKRKARFDPLLDIAFKGLLNNREATCFLVDRDSQLIHLCGDTLKLLRIVTGRASQNVVEMLPPALQLPLSTALHRARQKESNVHYASCQYEDESTQELRHVTIEVSHQQSSDTGSFMLVMIEKKAAPILCDVPEQVVSDEGMASYLKQLQQELQANQENLQATVEELETTNEEQQATNEELIASNEELQSTNEELHSVNEELYTVNSEYQSKIQELTELNSDHDNLLVNTNVGVIYLDDDLRVRKFTPAATTAFNLASVDIGRPLEHLSHSLEDFDVFEAITAVKAQAKPQDYEVKLKKDGPYLLMRVSPYVKDDHSADGFIITLINVDDIKQTQQQLAETTQKLHAANELLEQQVQERTAELNSSRQLLESITKATPNAIYIYDLDKHQNVYANAFLERLLGYSAEDLEALGSDLNEHLFHPDDLPHIARHHQDIFESTEADTHVFELEYRIRDVQGNWRYFYSQDIVFTRADSGEPTQILGTAVDISDRKATRNQLELSEARYRQLYENTPVMMHSTDLEGNILRVNNTWLERLGYSEAEVLNQPIEQFITCTIKPDNPDEPIAPHTACLDINECYDVSCQAVCKDETVLDIVLSSVLHQSEEQSANRLLSVLIDVTERNKIDQELTHYKSHLEELVAARAAEIQETNQQLKQEATERLQVQNELAKRAQSLERSNADLEQFAYVVSHDLQEPLRAMTVFSQLLKQRYHAKLGDDAGNYIKHIVDGGIRMQALIDGILDFSRITHRGQTLTRIPMTALVETVLSNIKPLISEEDATVTYGELPTLIADENQISQLFQNLISNAIKFKGEQPPKIYISGKLLPPENGIPASWLFQVKDNGIGIQAEQQERIFSLFQRLHTRQELEGYGIGLAICKKIAERHNGRIWVESSPGKGSSFYFTLEKFTEV